MTGLTNDDIWKEKHVTNGGLMCEWYVNKSASRIGENLGNVIGWPSSQFLLSACRVKIQKYIFFTRIYKQLFYRRWRVQSVLHYLFLIIGYRSEKNKVQIADIVLETNKITAEHSYMKNKSVQIRDKFNYKMIYICVPICWEAFYSLRMS